MVPRISPRSARADSPTALFVAVVALVTVSLAVPAVGAAPGPGDSLEETPDTGDVPAGEGNDSVNETRDVVDTATNVTDERSDDSNESDGVAPSGPSNGSSDGETLDPDSSGNDGQSDGSPWTLNWSETSESVAERRSMVREGLQAPPPTDGTEREDGTSGTETQADLGASASDSQPAESDRSPALDDVTPNGGDGDCRGCTVVGGGVGIVIGLGVSRRVGAAVSLGAPVSGMTAAQSLQTVTHWLDQRLPRLPPVLPGQYNRRDDSDPLAHTRRSELAAVVSESPGMPLTTLSDRMDVPRSSLRYHVRILEEEGELETTRILGRRRVFPAGENAELVAALADEGTRRIVTTLARMQPATGCRLADEAGKSNSTVSYHLDRLAEAGVVERDRDGRQVYNRLTADAEELVTNVDAARPVEEAK